MEHMEDALLVKMFCNKWRWESIIGKAIEVKDMDKGVMRVICDAAVINWIYEGIRDDKFCIAPPHLQKIPKGNGEFREVYINEDLDRIILSIINDLLFELCPELVHERCKSYQTHLGTGKVVKEVTDALVKISRFDIGEKADLSKYFDSVPMGKILECLDKIEEHLRKKKLLGRGHSKVINVLRRYYSQNTYFPYKSLVPEEKFQSLKQGCATASFLADMCLYEIDEEISKMTDYYVRYSDDILILGNNWKPAAKRLEEMLNEIGLVLNPKKVEKLYKNRYFKFLGFSLRGNKRTLSAPRVRREKGTDKNGFQEEIIKIVKKCQLKGVSALRPVLKFLYVGDGKYSWATSVLTVINCEEDIKVLDEWVKDCIRATMCGIKIRNFGKELGGLGCEFGKSSKAGIVTRGTGSRVETLRKRTPEIIPGYKSMTLMRNALMTDREVYLSLVSDI